VNIQLTPDILLQAYARGFFPMAESRDDPEIFWFAPEERGILPVSPPRLPRRLVQLLRRTGWTVTFNKDFRGVIRGCATAREGTWINAAIEEAYAGLFDAGHAASVEVWRGPELIGGVYGVKLGAAFFGESMFSRASNASKVALGHLLIRLNLAGYQLFDAQYVNPHLIQFGAEAVPRKEYLRRLSGAVAAQVSPLRAVDYSASSSASGAGVAAGLVSGSDSFVSAADDSAFAAALQSITQTS
jgi:leucyl/phenylalanyl-tRNA--protein transferase